VLEVDCPRLRARVHPDGSRVEGLAVLGQDLQAVAGKGEPMSDYIIGCFAGAFIRALGVTVASSGLLAGRQGVSRGMCCRPPGLVGQDV
jgi:hypothetical protein